MPISESRRKANDKYIEKLDDIKVRVPKGTREQLRQIAESKGYSLNGYIKHLLEQDTGLEL